MDRLKVFYWRELVSGSWKSRREKILGVITGPKLA
jgi:hypothetical protein